MHVSMSRANRNRQIRRQISKFFAVSAMCCISTMCAAILLPVLVVIVTKLGFFDAQVVIEWMGVYINSNITKTVVLTCLFCTTWFGLASILIRPWTPPR